MPLHQNTPYSILAAAHRPQTTRTKVGMSLKWRKQIRTKKKKASNVWPPEMALSIGRYKSTIQTEVPVAIP